ASKPGRTRGRFRAPPVRLHDLVQTSRAVPQTGARLAKIALLAALLKRAGPREIATAIAMPSGAPRQGRTGAGAAALADALAAPNPARARAPRSGPRLLPRAPRRDACGRPRGGGPCRPHRERPGSRALSRRAVPPGPADACPGRR